MAADEESAGQPAGVIECPVCGGKAEPGELICNFCGTRLAPEPNQPSEASAPSRASAPRSAVNPETFVPTRDRVDTRRVAAKAPIRTVESSGGRRLLGVVGYSLAAILALAAGAWLAIYLSSAHPKPQVAEVSPAASPSPAPPSGPSIQLATNIPLQVAGAAASAAERSHDTLTKAFEDNKAALFDAYRHALAGGGLVGDGMVVSVHIMPDGTVSAGSVRVSTTPNPSVDEEVVKAISGWKFAPTKAGDIDADYPLIFSANPGDAPGIESSLSAKLTSLAAGEPPEYAYSPGSAASPTGAPASPPVAEGSTPPSVASASTPAGVAAEPEAPPAVVAAPPPRGAHRTSRRREELASLPKSERMPKPTLLDRVTGELHSSRKLRRVQAYTSGGTVTLYGKVFDDNDKLFAERTARRVDGVSNVVNNLTTDTQEWAQNQARITQGLLSAGFGDVTVKVIGHDAYLGGEVKTDLDRERAVTIAEGAAPVKVRTNLIRVAPGRVFGF
jgi:TonB family protein